MKYDNYSQYISEYDVDERPVLFNVQYNKEIDEEIIRVKGKIEKSDIREFRKKILDRWGIYTPMDRVYYTEYLCSEKDIDTFVNDLRFDCF